jgi:hypothetical protein
MYRPLAGQLRILFCDIQQKKNRALLLKLYEKLELIPLKGIKYLEQGTYGGDLAWANRMAAISENQNERAKIAAMPFEISVFDNGLEVCDLILDYESPKIPLNEWLGRKIAIHPIDVSIIDLIRHVADRGGGSHIHPKIDSYIADLQNTTPTKVGFDALFSVALGRFSQHIGFALIQLYERYGVKGRPKDIQGSFDFQHESILNSAQIPPALLNQSHTKYNMTSIQNPSQVWLDR